jgi:hypothetical protein
MRKTLAEDLPLEPLEQAALIPFAQTSDRPDATDTPSDKSVLENELSVNAPLNSGLLRLIREYPQAYFPTYQIDETLLPSPESHGNSGFLAALVYPAVPSIAVGYHLYINIEPLTPRPPTLAVGDRTNEAIAEAVLQVYLEALWVLGDGLEAR